MNVQQQGKGGITLGTILLTVGWFYSPLVKMGSMQQICCWEEWTTLLLHCWSVSVTQPLFTPSNTEILLPVVQTDQHNKNIQLLGGNVSSVTEGITENKIRYSRRITDDSTKLVRRPSEKLAQVQVQEFVESQSVSTGGLGIMLTAVC